MAEFGDRQVHLLKLDIEGSEYEVVPTLDLPTMGVRVLCVEFHHNEPARAAKAILSVLARQGYEIVHRHEPSAFTLVRSER